MPVNLVSTACLGNLNDPSYELLLRQELGGVFGVDELLLDWDQADARTFVGVTELGRTVDIRLGAADGDRLADGDVLVIDRSGIVPVAVVVRLRGMLGRRPVAANGLPLVMAFPRCSSVHTCFMAYPIDIAFIDARGYVLVCYENVRPWRMCSCPGAWAVLERPSIIVSTPALQRVPA